MAGGQQPSKKAILAMAVLLLVVGNVMVMMLSGGEAEKAAKEKKDGKGAGRAMGGRGQRRLTLDADASLVAKLSKPELRRFVAALQATLREQNSVRSDEKQIVRRMHGHYSGVIDALDEEVEQCRELVREVRRLTDDELTKGVEAGPVVAEYLMEDEEEAELLARRREVLDEALASGSSLPGPYIFVHLAKTGGTSLISSIKEVVPHNALLHFWRAPGEEEARQQVALHLRGERGEEAREGGEQAVPLQVIMGHVSYGAHLWWPEEEPLEEFTYFTMLRHPVARVMSHYNYHKNKVQDPNHVFAQDRSLAQWVKDMKYGQNAMTAYLSGYEHHAWWYANDASLPLLRHAVLLPDDEWQTPGVEGDRLRSSNCTQLRDENYRVTYGHYRRARRNLLSMIVGLQEDYGESVAHINRWLGMADVHVRHMNSGVKRSEHDLSDEDLDTILQYNQWDMRLYDLARLLFQQQRESIGRHVGGEQE